MEINNRGFAELVGETILLIDTSCINVVKVHCASGKIVEINGDEQHYGIAVINATIGQYDR